MKSTREIHGGESKHLNRFAITAIAVAPVVAAIVLTMVIMALMGKFG